MLLGILLTLLGLYLLSLLIIARLSLTPPRTPIFCSPGMFGAPQEEVEFEGPEGVLRGWWIEKENATAVGILLHGYVMNRSELAPLAFQLWRAGVSTLTFDFRCHGRSRGKRSTIGWLEKNDVLAAIHYVKSRRPGTRIFLIGSSMGAVAGALALGDQPTNIDALIMDSGYSRLCEAVPGWWRFIGGKPAQILFYPVMPLSALMARMNPYAIDAAKSLEKASHIPVLIIHGDADDLASPAAAERNHRATGAQEPIVWLPRCGHAEGRWIHPEFYWSSIRDFLQKHGLLNVEEIGPQTDD